MNATNRALNRIILLILGLVLLAIGAVLVAASAVPGVGESWRMSGEAVQAWASHAWEDTKIAGTQLSWLIIGMLAALLLLIVLLIVLIGRGVRGRRRSPLRATGSASELGRITLTDGFAADAIKNALSDRDEILTTKVTANDVKKRPVLHVGVTPRQNTSPLAVAHTLDTLVTNLETLTGQQVATYISVHSGIRARLAHDQRRLN